MTNPEYQNNKQDFLEILPIFFCCLATLYTGHVLSQSLTGRSFEVKTLFFYLPVTLLVSSALLLRLIHSTCDSFRSTIIYFERLTWLLVGVFTICLLWFPEVVLTKTIVGGFYLFIVFYRFTLKGFILVRKSPSRKKLCLSLFFSSLWFFISVFLWSGPVHQVSGDEPHYLLMTDSIVHDADLNLFNQYQSKAYSSYYTGELIPKPSDKVEPGQIYSRGLGASFPLLLSLPYAIAGFSGAQFFIIFCAALLILQLFRLLTKETQLQRESLIVSWLTAVSLPLITYSSLIYPDIPAALLIVSALILLQKKPATKESKSVTAWIILICAVLLFLKFRYTVPVILLLIPLCSKGYINRRRKPLLLFSVLFFTALYFSIDYLYLSGDLFQHRFGGITKLKEYLPDWNSLKVLPGLLFDQESGLLFYAPLFLMIPLGLKLYKGSKTAVYWVALLGIPLTILSLLGHFAWHCLPTPPLRYLLPVIPASSLFLIPLFENWKKQSLHVRSLVTFLSLSNILFSYFLMLEPSLQINLADGSAEHLVKLSQITQMPVAHWLPSIIRPGSEILTLFFLIVFSLILCFLTKQIRRFSLKNMILVTLALIFSTGMMVLNISFRSITLHAEDTWWVQTESGAFYPENRDPFFHRETTYGWDLSPDSSILFPIRINPDSYSLLVTCKLHECGKGELLEILINGTEVNKIKIQSPDWMTFGCRINLTESDNIILQTSDKNQSDIAIDKIELIPASSYTSRIWFSLSDIFRSIDMNRLAYLCMNNGLLRFPGDPWYELQKIMPGAKMSSSSSSIEKPLTENLRNLFLSDVLGQDTKTIQKTEILFNVFLWRKLSDSQLDDYLLSGLGSGHPGALRYISRHKDHEYLTMDKNLIMAAHDVFNGNLVGTAQYLDQYLTQSGTSHFPLQLSKPEFFVSVDNPLRRVFSKLNNDLEYQNIAELVSVKHLVDAVSSFHQGNDRECALYFDAFYLSDFSLFMEKAVSISPEFCRMAFRYASRIHSQHIRELIRQTLENHHYITALAAADYGKRMFPDNADIMYLRALSLYYLRRFDESRQECLETMARFHSDDRTRWLTEQIMDRLQDQSRSNGAIRDTLAE